MADDKNLLNPYGGSFSTIDKSRQNAFNSKVNQVAGVSTPSTTVNAKDPVLYMGPDSRIAFMSQSAAEGQFYKWDEKTKNKFLSQLSLAGYDTSKMRDEDLSTVWASYVQASAKYYTTGGQAISPWDIMAKERMQREAAAGPKTTTATSTSYDMSTREDAHAIFLQAAQTLLGRDPTKKEISSFQRALNDYEKANPTTTTTTTTTEGGSVTAQSSTTKGGVKEGARQLMAMEDIKQDPEYGAYQAATSGMNWLMEMIGG